MDDCDVCGDLVSDADRCNLCPGVQHAACCNTADCFGDIGDDDDA